MIAIVRLTVLFFIEFSCVRLTTNLLILNKVNILIIIATLQIKKKHKTNYTSTIYASSHQHLKIEPMTLYPPVILTMIRFHSHPHIDGRKLIGHPSVTAIYRQFGVRTSAMLSSKKAETHLGRKASRIRYPGGPLTTSLG